MIHGKESSRESSRPEVVHSKRRSIEVASFGSYPIVSGIGVLTGFFAEPLFEFQLRPTETLPALILSNADQPRDSVRADRLHPIAALWSRCAQLHTFSGAAVVLIAARSPLDEAGWQSRCQARESGRTGTSSDAGEITRASPPRWLPKKSDFQGQFSCGCSTLSILYLVRRRFQCQILLFVQPR